jgi:hypothetical protein
MATPNLRLTDKSRPDSNSWMAGDVRDQFPEYWWLPDHADIFDWEQKGSNGYNYPRMKSVAWDFISLPPKTWIFVYLNTYHGSFHADGSPKNYQLAAKVNQYEHGEVNAYWWGQCSAPFPVTHGWHAHTIVTPADIPVRVEAFLPYEKTESLVQL